MGAIPRVGESGSEPVCDSLCEEAFFGVVPIFLPSKGGILTKGALLTDLSVRAVLSLHDKGRF